MSWRTVWSWYSGQLSPTWMHTAARLLHAERGKRLLSWRLFRATWWRRRCRRDRRHWNGFACLIIWYTFFSSLCVGFEMFLSSRLFCYSQSGMVMFWWYLSVWRVPTHPWKSLKVLEFFSQIQDLESTWKQDRCLKVLEFHSTGPWKSLNSPSQTARYRPLR